MVHATCQANSAASPGCAVAAAAALMIIDGIHIAEHPIMMIIIIIVMIIMVIMIMMIIMIN